MPRTLAADALREVMAPLQRANAAFAARHPGDAGGRQPVHTVYGGAQLFRADVASRMGALALRSLDQFAPDAATLAAALGLPSRLADTVYARVREKLAREPVEDFRIDYEDGYGNRPDAEEDGHASSVAAEVAAGIRDGVLPPYLGIRIKPLTEELRERSVRTLDLFLTTLVTESGGALPGNFVVTLPKITVPEQVAAMAELCERLEAGLGLASGALRFEMMVETPQSIFADDGTVALPRLLDEARSRCTAAHFGTYDYTASNNITAAHQHMNHPACDFARQVMQVSLAGRGVWLSDGATNVMPVAPHRLGPDAAPGETLSAAQEEENRTSVHRAWKLAYDHIQHSLELGFYQGWDLHPAQLPIRYAAVYAFFLDGLDAAAERLSNFVAKAAQATLVGDVFDDAATGQGLLNFFLRAINSGAISEEEAAPRCGLTLEELRTRSFVAILAGRRG
ncbi:MAG TPA: phosphoenolpyruvate kinase [Thermoanaerobaculia bacterium]|nr:phosphoenolpyruvate kinase [Thermoanaerobaculia bacterium]